jgi:hypothetical protein
VWEQVDSALRNKIREVTYDNGAFALPTISPLSVCKMASSPSASSDLEVYEQHVKQKNERDIPKSKGLKRSIQSVLSPELELVSIFNAF